MGDSMLIVTGTFEIDPESVSQGVTAARDMVAQTLKEPGCITYEFSQILGSENRFRVYEEWQDLAALEAHFVTPHMTTFRAALAGIGVLSRDIYRMDAGEKVPLG